MTEATPNKVEAANVIARIAEAARAIGFQANVGAMETAGSIISFLDRHPEHIADFMAGGSVMDWPIGWHALGSLSWHGMDGKVHEPQRVRQHMLIKKMERGEI